MEGTDCEVRAGIDDDLTGWTLWRRIEQGKEYRFAKDASGVIRLSLKKNDFISTIHLTKSYSY